MAVGAFVADCERLVGIGEKKPSEVLVIYEVRGPQIGRFWEGPLMAPDQVTTSSDSAVGVGRRIHEAVNRHDADAAAALFADTVIYHRLGDTTVVRIARADLRDAYAKTAQWESPW